MNDYLWNIQQGVFYHHGSVGGAAARSDVSTSLNEEAVEAAYQEVGRVVQKERADRAHARYSLNEEAVMEGRGPLDDGLYPFPVARRPLPAPGPNL